MQHKSLLHSKALKLASPTFIRLLKSFLMAYSHTTQIATDTLSFLYVHQHVDTLKPYLVCNTSCGHILYVHNMSDSPPSNEFNSIIFRHCARALMLCDLTFREVFEDLCARLGITFSSGFSGCVTCESVLWVVCVWQVIPKKSCL